MAIKSEWKRVIEGALLIGRKEVVAASMAAQAARLENPTPPPAKAEGK